MMSATMWQSASHAHAHAHACEEREHSLVPPLQCEAPPSVLTSPASTSTSPPPPPPPPRPHTPMSKLPRCAVVNFRKDGGSLAWKPRLSQNVGGLAARVHNFEDAFSLEEFSSRALRAPQSMQYGGCAPYSSSLAAATKLNVNAPHSLKFGTPSAHAAQRARAARVLAGAQRHVEMDADGEASHRPAVQTSARGVRRSALSFFRRLLHKERRNRQARTAQMNETRTQRVLPQQRSGVKYHHPSPLSTPPSTPPETPPSRHSGGGGGLSRKLSDSTVTDESEPSGSPQVNAAGHVRFEQKSKSVWKPSRNAAAHEGRRRVRSSLGGRPLPGLRRRMHKHSEMGASSSGNDDPYVRFITSVM